MARPLSEKDFLEDPVNEFRKWYRLAGRCFWLEFPDAMCLSTMDEDGLPDGRMVLLKSFDERGFVFFTNFNSRKGRSLKAFPRAALTFYWENLQRQVRIQGDVEEVSAAEADAYFSTRLRTSQLGAWASRQSESLAGRKVLLDRLAEYKARFAGQPVPRPDYWSGFRVRPARVEFWKLRFNRLHDRFVYTRKPEGGWKFERLYP